MVLSKKKEKGQGLVEYALILVLVAVIVLAVMAITGSTISTVYCSVVVALDPGATCDSGGGTLTDFGYGYYRNSTTEADAIAQYCDIPSVPSGAGYNLYSNSSIPGYTVDGYGQDFPEISFIGTGTCP